MFAVRVVAVANVVVVVVTVDMVVVVFVFRWYCRLVVVIATLAIIADVVFLAVVAWA